MTAAIIPIALAAYGAYSQNAAQQKAKKAAQQQPEGMTPQFGAPRLMPGTYAPRAPAIPPPGMPNVGPDQNPAPVGGMQQMDATSMLRNILQGTSTSGS